MKVLLKVIVVYNLFLFGSIIIIIAHDWALYKMLDKFKIACSIRKKPTLNNCVFECFTKVSEPTSDPLIHQATHSNNWDQQQQKLSNHKPSCGQAQQDPHKPLISKKSKKPVTAEP